MYERTPNCQTVHICWWWQWKVEKKSKSLGTHLHWRFSHSGFGAIPYLSNQSIHTPGGSKCWKKTGWGYEGKKSPKASYPRKFETSDPVGKNCRKITWERIFQGRCGPKVKQMLQSCLQCHRDSVTDTHAFWVFFSKPNHTPGNIWQCIKHIQTLNYSSVRVAPKTKEFATKIHKERTTIQCFSS